MPEAVVIGIGEYQAAAPPHRLVTYGLGSCVGITLHELSTGKGAMAHTLLPCSPRTTPAEISAKYTDTAIELMLEQLVESGCDGTALVAKLAGGAAMFQDLYRQGQVGIGCRNIEAARETLARLGIPVVAEDVGGSIGRSLSFDLESGLLSIRTLSQPDATI